MTAIVSNMNMTATATTTTKMDKQQHIEGIVDFLKSFGFSREDVEFILTSDAPSTFTEYPARSHSYWHRLSSAIDAVLQYHPVLFGFDIFAEKIRTHRECLLKNPICQIADVEYYDMGGEARCSFFDAFYGRMTNLTFTWPQTPNGFGLPDNSSLEDFAVLYLLDFLFEHACSTIGWSKSSPQAIMIGDALIRLGSDVVTSSIVKKFYEISLKPLRQHCHDDGVVIDSDDILRAGAELGLNQA